MKAVRLFLISYPVFVFVDILWLGYLMRNVYRSQLGFLTSMSDGSMHVIWPAALLVWALIVVGAILFALPRTDGSLGSGFLWGALYGLVLYGVYDLTNLALIKGWPLAVTLIDIVWGMTINALLTTFLVWLSSRV